MSEGPDPKLRIIMIGRAVLKVHLARDEEANWCGLTCFRQAFCIDQRLQSNSIPKLKDYMLGHADILSGASFEVYAVSRTFEASQS